MRTAVPGSMFPVPRSWSRFRSMCVVRVLCSAVLGFGLLAGCSRETATRVEQRQDGWIVSADGAGPVRLGMSRRELTARGGAVNSESEACEYVTPQGAPPGVRAMVVNGTVRRVDISSPGVATREGVGVGSTETQILAAYSNVTVQPHKYTSGHYLTADLAAGPLGTPKLVFETDGQTATRYRVGLPPEVEWVEGCG